MADEGLNLIQIRSIELKSPNPATFTTPYHWSLRFDVLNPLPGPIGVAVSWVASTTTSSLDLVLDNFEFDATTAGLNDVDFEHPAPDPTRIPTEELHCHTLLFMTFSYNGAAFARVGYWVNVAAFGAEAFAAATSGEGSIPPPPVPAEAEDGGEAAAEALKPGSGSLAVWPRNAYLARFLGREVCGDRPHLDLFPFDWQACLLKPAVNNAGGHVNGDAIPNQD